LEPSVVSATICLVLNRARHHLAASFSCIDAMQSNVANTIVDCFTSSTANETGV